MHLKFRLENGGEFGLSVLVWIVPQRSYIEIGNFYKIGHFAVCVIFFPPLCWRHDMEMLTASLALVSSINSIQLNMFID